MKRTASVLWLLLCALFALADPGRATKIIYQSPKQLAEESSAIVRGKVADVRTFWNAEQTKIFTEVRVSIDETYKGARAPEVRVLQLGGIVGHVKMNVEGALAWRPNEEVLLFLEPSVAGAFQVAGFSQGKFAIERDAKTGAAFVEGPPVESLDIVGKPPASSARVRMPLEKFITQTVGAE
jgi:hypothetical protein